MIICIINGNYYSDEHKISTSSLQLKNSLINRNLHKYFQSKNLTNLIIY